MGGVVTVSIEIELGWGMHDLGRYGHLSENCAEERRYLSKLLDACDRYEVPISFDVVGHLLLEGCDGTHDGPYPEGWFDADPGTSVDDDPAFYAPDVVEDVRSRSVDHELCTHTFSHVLCDRMDSAVVDADLRRSQALHAALDGPTESLVPPRHYMAPRRVLRERGIEVVRRDVRTERQNAAARFKQLLADPYFRRQPRVVDGVVETYCTSFPSLSAPALPAGRKKAHPAFRPLPVSVRQRLHARRLRTTTERTADEDGHLHLWCHLFDVANEQQWQPLSEYVETLARLRDERDLTVATMRDLNRRVRGRVVAD